MIGKRVLSAGSVGLVLLACVAEESLGKHTPGSGGAAGSAGAGATAGVSGMAGAGATGGSGVAQCQLPSASCDGAEATGCETDLASDPQHCRWCDRRCDVGGCEAGYCRALGKGGVAFGIAADESFVYHAYDEKGYAGIILGGQCRLTRTSVTTLAPELMYLADDTLCLGVEVDATHVYFSVRGAVQRIDKTATAGDGKVPEAIANALAFALDSTHIYFVDEDGTLKRAPKAQPSNAVELGTYAPAITGLPFLRINATSVFWGLPASAGEDSVILITPKSGGQTETWVDGIDTLGALEIDAGHVYWTDKAPFPSGNWYSSSVAAGSVWRRALSGGVIEEIAKNQERPYGLRSDGNTLYWVEGGQGRVWRSNPDGSAAAVMTDGFVRCQTSGTRCGNADLLTNLVVTQSEVFFLDLSMGFWGVSK